MGESFKFSYKPQRRESLGLAVYNTGFQKCETGHSWGPGVRDHYLIHYIVSGKGAYEFGGKTYHLTTGDAFLVYPNQTAFYTADKTDPWEYYWVGFNGTEAERLLHLTDFSHNSPIIHYGGDEKLRQSLLDIYHAGGSSAANEARMIGKLYLFF